MLREYKAEQGKVWKSKTTGDLLSDSLHLGIQDTIDNYEEVNIPKDDNSIE